MDNNRPTLNEDRTTVLTSIMYTAAILHEAGLLTQCPDFDTAPGLTLSVMALKEPGLGRGVEKGTQKAITPTFSWVQMASIPYANSGGGEGGHNEQRPSSSDRRKPPSLL